jgi:hypothetical protein
MAAGRSEMVSTTAQWTDSRLSAVLCLSFDNLLSALPTIRCALSGVILQPTMQCALRCLASLQLTVRSALSGDLTIDYPMFSTLSVDY